MCARLEAPAPLCMFVPCGSYRVDAAFFLWLGYADTLRLAALPLPGPQRLLVRRDDYVETFIVIAEMVS